MGTAEVIPGVSGGTIAFITGIYERLLKSIKEFDVAFFKLLLSGKFKAAWNKIDTTFLILLLGGMACGIIAGVFGITHLMETYPEILWAFFSGLIVASAWYVGKQVEGWNVQRIVALIAGIAVAFTITIVSPAEGSTNLLYVAVSGTLAICALMLPGISGSFILLLLGMYTVVIGSVKEVLSGNFENFILILCFVGGMTIGLMAFSRVLTWMFQHYRMTTLALLSGFMIGSLPKIWPWRIPTRWMDEDGSLVTTGIPGEHARILSERPVFPGDYLNGDPHTTLVIVSFLCGFFVILVAAYFEKKLGAPQHMA